MSFSVRIISPKGLAYEGIVNSANIPLVNGPFGILSGHTPFIGMLSEKGVAIFSEADSNKKIYFVVYGGTLETKSGGDSLLLVEECRKADSLEETNSILNEPRMMMVDEDDGDLEKASIAIAKK